MDYYKILGIPNTASADEIKTAYRKLASQHHPDKGGDTAKFQEIQVAYATVSDEGKRHQYDAQRSGARRPQFQWNTSTAPQDINEVFRQFGFDGHDPFGQFRTQQQQQPRRNKDLRIEIPLSLASTLQDQSKTIQIKTNGGTPSAIEVKIPRGITNDVTIKYNGLGDNLVTTLPRGDLYVHFSIHRVENFHVNGLDLYTQVNVNCLLATVGGKVVVTGLDDKTFELTLPIGTQAGKKFRISGQGLFQRDTETRGDLYVEVTLTVPENLTDEQLDSIRNLLDANTK
jgi:DnaJ-class molecular chaperone